MPQITLKVPHRLAVWFRSAVPPGVSRSEYLRQLIRRAGRHPEKTVCPNDMTLDGTETFPLRLDAETADILDCAAAQMCMSRTAYCMHLMRHADLTVTVALDAAQMARLRQVSDGDTETFVRDLILRQINTPEAEENAADGL